MTTFARAQFLYSTDGTDPATCAITPGAASSLLVAQCNERSGGTEANHAVTDSLGNTWTKVVGHNQAFGDSNARQSVSLWTCPAGNTTARTVSFDDGTANGKRLSVAEYTTDSTGTWEFQAEVSADTGTGSTPPIATGSTSSVAAGDLLVIAWAAWRTNAPQAYDVTIGTGFSAVGDTGAGTNGRQHATAWKKDTVGGTFSASVGWTGSGHEGSAGVLVMKLAPAGPGPIPVSTGPLTKTNDTYTGYRIGGFSATDDVAVTKWRIRIEGGSWTEFGIVTYIDVSGRTHGDIETVDVQAGDAAGNWSNTLTIEAHVGWRDESLHGLSFPANASGNSNISMLMGNPPPRGSCTILWWERVLSQSDYYGGMIFAPQTSTFDGGRYTTLFVGHGCSGAFDSTGQRTTGQSTPIYHEIAGLYDGGSSYDYIASPESIVGPGNQVAHLVPFGVWKRRAVEIEPMVIDDVAVYRHTDYVDLDDPSKTIVHDWPESRLDLQGNDPGLWYGTPPWITAANATENAHGQVSKIRGFGAPIGLANIQLESVATSDAAVTVAGAAALHYSNISPTVTDITDKSGNGNHFVWQGSFRPTNYTESIEVEVPAPLDLGAAAVAQASSTAALGLVKSLAASAGSSATGGATLLKGVALSAAGLAVVTAGASISHSVPLYASAAVVAMAGAQMVLAVTLSASGLGVAAASAGASLLKPLGASGIAQAGGSASLTTNASADLLASGAGVASGTATLSLLITLSGAAVAQAQAAAAVAMQKRLGADGAAQSDGSATLTTNSSTALAAVGAAQASSGASLWLDVPLTAAALSQALAGGSITLSVPLRASAAAQATALANLAGSVGLSAGAVALSDATASLQVMGPVIEFARGMVARNEPRDWTAKNERRSWKATA